MNEQDPQQKKPDRKRTPEFDREDAAMRLRLETATILRNSMFYHKLTIEDVAEKGSLDPVHIRQILNAELDFEIETLVCIAQAAGVHNLRLIST